MVNICWRDFNFVAIAVHTLKGRFYLFHVVFICCCCWGSTA
jgi:hypothetical protein